MDQHFRNTLSCQDLDAAPIGFRLATFSCVMWQKAGRTQNNVGTAVIISCRASMANRLTPQCSGSSGLWYPLSLFCIPLSLLLEIFFALQFYNQE